MSKISKIDTVIKYTLEGSKESIQQHLEELHNQYVSLGEQDIIYSKPHCMLIIKRKSDMGVHEICFNGYPDKPVKKDPLEV